MSFDKLMYKGKELVIPKKMVSGVAYYSWVSYGNPIVWGVKPKPTPENKIFCAWCGKPRSEIENPNDHVNSHANYDYLLNYYTGRDTQV